MNWFGLTAERAVLGVCVFPAKLKDPTGEFPNMLAPYILPNPPQAESAEDVRFPKGMPAVEPKGLTAFAATLNTCS